MTEIVSQVVADLQEQWRVAGEDSDRREAVIVDGLARLVPPPPDSAGARRAAIEAAIAAPDVAGALAALGIRRAMPLNRIDPRLPDRLLSAHNQSGTIIAAGTVAVLAGEGGIAKSAMALSIACGMAEERDEIAGDPSLFVGERGPVLFATYEDDPGVTAWRASMLAGQGRSGITPKALQHVHVLGMTGRPLFGPCDGDNRTPLYNARPGPLEGWRDLWSAADEIRPKLIVIDPALAAYVGDSNAAAPVREFIGALAHAANAIAAGVLLVAHSTKSARGGQHTRPDPYDPGQVGGSAAWTDGARAALSMTWQGGGDDGPRFRCLAISKANYGPAKIWCEAIPIRTGRFTCAPKAIVGFRAAKAGWQSGTPKLETAKSVEEQHQPGEPAWAPEDDL